MKRLKEIVGSPIVRKMKKIVESAVFIFVIETCCLTLTFIYGQRMSLRLEILIMIIGGVLLPIEIVIPRWQKWQQPHLPLEWWVQAVFHILMFAILLPMYIHGGSEACALATVLGSILAFASVLLWLRMLFGYLRETRWPRIWRQANRH